MSLYHTAPCAWMVAAQRCGGTVVLMEHFDAAGALAAIARERVTHSWFVPTMFIRLLRLPPDVRAAADLSSLRQARSEEHTSELQSLMRISYAVFCLTKQQQ